MRRLGTLLLSAALLGLPRALKVRALQARRWAFTLAGESDAELRDFARELGRALGEARPEPPARNRPVPVEVELHRCWRAPGPGGRVLETLSVSVVQGSRSRRLLAALPPTRAASA